MPKPAAGSNGFVISTNAEAFDGRLAVIPLKYRHGPP